MRKQFFEGRRLLIDDNPFVLSGEMGNWHTVQTIIRRRGVCVCVGGGEEGKVRGCRESFQSKFGQWRRHEKCRTYSSLYLLLD